MTPMEQAVSLLGAGRFHEALQLFGAVLREHPLAVEPRVGLAQACEGIGDTWAAAVTSSLCAIACYTGSRYTAAAQTAGCGQ